MRCIQAALGNLTYFLRQEERMSLVSKIHDKAIPGVQFLQLICYSLDFFVTQVII